MPLKTNPIQSKSFEFGVKMIRLSKQVKENQNFAISDQLLRSGTSIGANVEEAQAGETRADFIHKYGIAQKEAREAIYWLNLLAEAGIVPKRRLAPLIKETEELYAIITAIIKNAKSKSKMQS